MVTAQDIDDSLVSREELESELQESASRYHMIGAWVAIIFDPIFGIVDYINIPQGWLQIFVLRISVAVLTLLAMVLHKKGKLSTYQFIFVPLFLVSFQNAFTYSLVGSESLLGHNLNYLTLFLGAGLFLLWPMVYSLIALGISALASFGFILLNESIDSANFAVEGGILLVTAAVFSTLLIQARYRSRIREIKYRMSLRKSLALTELQRDEIEQKSLLLEQQARDLAEAKLKIEQANARLLDQNEHLEEMVQSRTAVLRKTSSERDQLVYRLSHDFRTPVVNIRGLLGMADSATDTAMRSMVLEKVNETLNRFDDLGVAMGNFSIYARDKLELQHFSLGELAREAWSKLGTLVKEADAMEFEGNGEIGLHSDRTKLMVVLQSVMNNSLRYRKVGVPVQVRVSATQTEGFLLLVIRDNGSGIEPDLIHRVFEMFFRGDARSMGAGLGLYVAQGIAGQLGGSIQVSSDYQEGTEVRITLQNPLAV